jgi:hypothetical protein
VSNHILSFVFKGGFLYSNLLFRACSFFICLYLFQTYTKEEYDDVQILDFSYPEKTPGLFAMRVDKCIVGHHCCDVVYLIKSVHDTRDLENKKNFKLELVEDGTGVILTEPVLPYYILHNLVEIQEMEHPEEQCNATARAHGVHSTEILQNPERMVRTTLYRFPDEVSCNLDYVNFDIDRVGQTATLNSRILVQHYRPPGFDTSRTGPLPLFLPMIFWKLAIDGSDKLILDRGEVTKNLSDAFARMKMP